MSPSRRQLAGYHRRRLLAIKKKLEQMAAEWGDLDGYNETVLWGMATQCDEVANNLSDFD